MTYLPSEYINTNYKYRINGDYYTIITNNNCYTQYTTQYCDCYNIYPKLDYIVSERISCNSNPSTYVNSDRFTSDYYYRIDFPNILIMFIIMCIFIVYIPLKLFSKIFRKGGL